MKRKREEKEGKSIQAKRNKAQRRNAAEETDLCGNVDRLREEVLACGNHKGNKVKYLKQQINSRLTRGKSVGMEYPVASVGPKFRSEKAKKIVVTARDKDNEVEYLTDLAGTLLTHDNNAPQVVSFAQENVLRALPRTCEDQKFRSSVKAKGEFERKIGDIVQVQDDDDLCNLRDKYVGKMAHDKDEGVSYRILDVNLTSHREHEYWVACCIPVVRVEGTRMVEDKHIAGGSAAAQREDRKPVYLHDSLNILPSAPSSMQMTQIGQRATSMQ